MQAFPISMDVPPTHKGALPAACDVVVIGGGVIGVMTAWFLTKAGKRVVLCEKGRIAGEQSGRNWGWIRQQARDADELPIMVESMAIWHGLVAELGDGLGFRQGGVVYMANKPADMAEFEAFMPHARAHGLDTRIMTRAEVGALLGACIWQGGMITPSDARAEPMVAVPLIASALAAKGCVIVEDCAVRGLDMANGRVAGVVTEQGEVACDAVVMAGGAWSSLFLRAQGIDIPQLSVLASVAATEPMPEIFAGNAADNHFAFRRRVDGGYTIAPGSEHDFFIGPDAFRHLPKYIPTLRNDFRSTHFRAAAPNGYPDAWRTPRLWDMSKPSPFEATRVLNPAPNMKTLSDVQDAFAAAYPHLGRPKLRCVWAGMIDTMPDIVPVLDAAPPTSGLSGLFIATGMSGHGFGIGPGVGRVMADMVLGRALGHDLTRFRLSRFTDGSKIKPAPAL
ncbi:NAD(P)/FAD-dependent oxidoreductase [Pseudorhodobacter ferrugineus]|uniref:NAD(P)/FAD-dependent oxidoreductase n=1 Tax=Pseudorhodobacter ferrugineus TaxID=77008 RepID=UPI0003B55877|nr:FAD-binding oxidoreductase [Pseudorhodobacter ferrugineus]